MTAALCVGLTLFLCASVLNPMWKPITVPLDPTALTIVADLGCSECQDLLRSLLTEASEDTRRVVIKTSGEQWDLHAGTIKWADCVPAAILFNAASSSWEVECSPTKESLERALRKGFK